MAAVAAARRAAALWRCALGAKVGYRVKGDSRAGRDTRVEFMTHGVFLRILQADPGLSSVGLVVFDEFHERSWQNDLCLALCRDLLSLRDDLRLLVMSATLDTAACETLLDAPSLSVPGIVHPVETRYRPIPAGQEPWSAAAREAIALAGECGGDVLVFLPGMAQIEEVAGMIARAAPGLSVCRLHSSVPLQAQMQVLEPPPDSPRRIILATSIAETSLTVPRVRAVVDAGLVRTNRFHQRSGLNHLVTETEAADRADQRRGRAGRIAPGICVRLWAERDSLPERTVPELFRSELSSALLESTLWGALRREDLPWMDLPPEAAWNAAHELLSMLGALDADGRISAKGRKMARFGIEPRLAAMIMEGVDSGESGRACFLAAFLDGQTSSAEAESDIERRIQSLDPAFLGRIRQEACRLERLTLPTAGRPDAAKTASVRAASAKAASPGGILAAGFPDRVARKVSAEGTHGLFQLATGRLLRVKGELARSDWIVAAEADAGIGPLPGTLYVGAHLSGEAALAILAPLTKETLELEWSGPAFRVRKRRRAQSIILSDTPEGRADPDLAAGSFARHLAAEGLAVLPWNENCVKLLGRIRAFWSLRIVDASPSTPVSTAYPDDAILAATAGTWLLPWIDASGNPVLGPEALARALENLVPDQYRRAFRDEAPASLMLPAGIRRSLEYRSDGSVLLEARIHEFFGMKTHPLVLGKPVVACLLSPAGRPVHITTDIPGFWRGAWSELRKELRGRYPKHDWPEDPSTVGPRLRSVKPRS